MPKPKPVFSAFVTFDTNNNDLPDLTKPENFTAAHVGTNEGAEPLFLFPDGSIRPLALWRWIFAVSQSGTLSLFQEGDYLA